MARIGFGAVTAAAGFYEFLRRRELEYFARWRTSGELRPYPRQRHLDDFEAGRSVNVQGGEIWGWNAVHDGAPATPRPVGDGISGARFIVSPDDSFVQDRDGANAAMALWLAENGL
jgi:hypothetical protein